MLCLLTISGTAALLGLSTERVRELVRSGVLEGAVLAHSPEPRPGEWQARYIVTESALRYLREHPGAARAVDQSSHPMK